MESTVRKLRQFNVDFYRGLLPWPTERLTIDKFHEQKHCRYDFLEKCHSYVQWLFPNQHKSNFNYHSYPLTEDERLQFRKDEQIGKNLIRSYAIYADFMGARIVNLETGELALVSKERLFAVLYVNRHNHLRLTRIMACLSHTGFRRYATALIRFLHNCIDKDKKLEDVRRVLEAKWLPYDDDMAILKICGIPNEEYLNLIHPVLLNKEALSEL